jgi:uncharacterized protein YjbJ (UPF0337 family)
MSGTTDKIKGAANETAGEIKRNIGRAVGSDRLEAEGAAQEIKGKAKDAADAIDEAAHRKL